MQKTNKILSNNIKNKVNIDSIVASFRANRENWKKLKVLATVNGLPVQDKLNEVIEEHLDTHYAKTLGLVERDVDESTKAE